MDTIEAKIQKWKSQFDLEIQKKLNYTPDSLNVVEQVLIDNYDNKYDLQLEENYDDLEASILYVGEIFRMHDEIRHLMWVDNTSKDNLFPTLECPLHSNSWVDIFKKYPIILHKRSGTVLHSFFIKNTEYFKANHEKLQKDIKSVPGKGGYSYQYYFLFKNHSFTISEIETLLQSYYHKKGRDNAVSFHNNHHLVIKMDGNYYFHLQFEKGKDILQESIEIAANYSGPKDISIITQHDSRIEFWGDEDVNGDYFNEHLYLLEQIQKTNKILIFNYKNGLFFDQI